MHQEDLDDIVRSEYVCRRGVEYKLYYLIEFCFSRRILIPEQIDAKINETKFKLNINYIKLEGCYKIQYIIQIYDSN